jgi:cardiolipin synthase
MDLPKILTLIYVLILIGVTIRIIYDTENSAKTLSYLLLIFLVPVFGIIFYLFFGMNFRKRKIFGQKLLTDEKATEDLNKKIIDYTNKNLLEEKLELRRAEGLIKLLLFDSFNPLISGNHVQLLTNGEEKFPKVFEAINSAKHHIHLEYYIIEPDELGNKIKDLLIKKAKEGVEVRLIADGFGSKGIRGKYIEELKKNGVEVYFFNPIKVLFLASKINYRNHRKIIVIDSKVAFVGGVNLCHKYVNTDEKGKLYWRDSHLKISGPAVLHLQMIFIQDWNFCSGKNITLNSPYFDYDFQPSHGTFVQIAASGPDCPRSIILLSMLKAINLAKDRLYITSPYFIPDVSIVNALKIAALSGVDVRILVPGISDSFTVNAAARSYYKELLKVGVKIYLYQKGFVHAKTMVVDEILAVVGTANMDIRSFDINFEVNANIYDSELAIQLGKEFINDLLYSKELNYEGWEKRPFTKVFPERIARLTSPLL